MFRSIPHVKQPTRWQQSRWGVKRPDPPPKKPPSFLLLLYIHLHMGTHETWLLTGREHTATCRVSVLVPPVMTPGCRRRRWDKLTPVQICSQRGRTASLQRCWKPNYKWGGSFLRLNSLVDEVDCLGFQLVGAMQIGEDEDVGGVLHGQTGAERVLTHDFKSLQGVLQERRALELASALGLKDEWEETTTMTKRKFHFSLTDISVSG